MVLENIYGDQFAQPDVTPKMRMVLVDWMIDVCEDNKMGANTLYLAVHLLDQLLRGFPIKRIQFQLLGCTCLYIAAKYDESEVYYFIL